MIKKGEKMIIQPVGMKVTVAELEVHGAMADLAEPGDNIKYVGRRGGLLSSLSGLAREKFTCVAAFRLRSRRCRETQVAPSAGQRSE